MLLGTDELTILRGSKFYGTWQWVNSVTGDPEDFAGLSATIKIKNIHEDFEDIKNVFEVGTAIIEPLDVDGNATKGRVDVSLSKADTLNFTIPQSEDDKYGESGFYAILEILLSTGEVILQAKVRIVESLESETLDFLLDERDEAIIISGKLDNILLRNDEYISTRDNLIDIVIPTAINTYNEKLDLYNQNHIEKLDTYNLNHVDKLQILEDIATIVNQDKNIVGQDKLDIEAMKQNVLDNKDSVTSMKDAIEIMLDTFDDRFLGKKASDPLTDNDGNPLDIAALYYNEIDKELKFYNGVSWDSPVAAAQTYALQASQSASDANASKLAAKTSEDNAKASEEVAIQKALEASQSASDANASKLAAKTSEGNAKASEETAIQKALEASQSADSISANRVVVEQLESSVQNLALQVTSDKQAVSLDKQTVLNAKTDIETIRDNLQSSADSISSKANIADVYTKTSLDLKISTQQFDKPTRGPLFVKVSPSSIKIPAGLKITLGTESFKVITDYTLTLASNLVGSTKTAGTDYYVYAKSDATFYISANDAITADRLIGGFHYGLIGETETVTGNKLEADMVKIRGINQYSFWDLKYRPVASPKGMVNIGGKWYDIYLLNSEHITNGTSKAGLTIAGGDSVTAGRLMPKIPLEYGGNNTLNYGKFTWFQACEVAKANAKRLISYSEFPTIAYGVLEGVSSSINAYETVAGKIEHYPNLTSKYGIEQATGTQWIWGSDLANYPTDTVWAWKANTDSRGQIHSTDNSPTAVILGGYRGDGVNAGSRASAWDHYVWGSGWHIGCRFACDHLELV